MAIFDEHLMGAKKHNQDDLRWLLACYYGTMMNLCQEYSCFGDEDLFSLMLEWFWLDFNRFTIREESRDALHNRNRSRNSSNKKKK